MPQLPTVVPIIVIGIMFGSLLKSEKPKISFKRVALWALIAGALNAALAYADFLLAPAAPTTGFAFRAAAVSATSQVSFTIASFLAAFLMVVVVFAIAAAYLRLRGGRTEGEVEAELTAEETSQLQPG